MAFESLTALLAMGGHAPYVWSAWGVAAALLIVSVAHARAERRQLIRELQRRNRRERNLSERETDER
ncbi:heme exporter protein CcmD [Modicisalibacter xianhensis]|uniref:Heme exporter protein D n=1 Tax=Modicisalibacter xianhensis TaxID=442341 RepID=A0A1I3ARV0_9GAMM|nr:heme exporter protein CcmD [Halomonas xianhensis]TDX29877.1 heme exporter protein D [Halomonas xianhensis]SFH52795.1 heme exporter protein D [Halomonas xianhensis]